MNAQASRKLIVVGVMAAVVAIGVTTFALRPHASFHAAPAATPPTALPESPVAEDAVATIPPTTPTVAPVASVAPVVAAPVTPAHKDVVVVKRTPGSAVEPKVAAKRHVAAPESEAPAASATVKPADVAPDFGMTAAAAAVASNSEPAQGAVANITPPATETVQMAPPAVTTDLSPQASVPAVASDSEITASVKSQIAVDSPGSGAAIGVNTSNGVVALTGSLATQADIDHIKLVVAGVKDVKSVDTSALTVPTT